ncbi:ABC1 kinase family protein [Alicyclobacillus vulcanalis]|uniref:Ubiquinone biosynthesis protein n=1 Tax=Alicyclobacillus vulcanalis TaxID=252246 RepID=A0A1N7MHT9_9BACL|nr:AarF/ABC1/UbiB kinase family protein [Alicyclobacillus vulcanalis]SIS85479.1 ubiquinone biosynthesis protein [Alicyclobacillus vulcanalis]
MAVALDVEERNELAKARRLIERERRKITPSRRQRDVVKALVKHGVLHVLRDRSRDEEAKQRLLGQRLRAAFEELGPTFIKLGQVIMTRQELLPEAVTAELAYLLDSVPPLPFHYMMAVLEEEIPNWTEVFRWIDPNPLGSASLAQVYRAQLADGRMAAVKIVRPLVDKLFQVDIGNVRKLVRRIQKLLPPQLEVSIDLHGIIEDYYSSTMNELDLRREAEIMEEQRSMVEEFETLYIPEVYHVTPRVLVMEFIDGWNLKDFPVDFYTFEERLERMTDLAHYYVKAFVEGNYHADPHASNLMVDKKTKRIAILDWGLVGRMDAAHTEAIFRMLMHVRVNQQEDAIEALLDIYEPTRYTDLVRLRDQLRSLLIHYTNSTQASVYNWGNLLLSTIVIAAKNYCRIPNGLALWTKGFSAAEGTARWLCPEISYHQLVEIADVQILRRWMMRRFNYHTNASFAAEFAKLTATLPRRLNKILEHFEWNDFRVNLDAQLSHQAVRTVHRVVNKLLLALMSGTFFLGGALLLAFADTRPVARGGIVDLGWGAVAASVALGISALWSTVRSKKRI